MYKPILALVATTLVSTFVLSAPFSTDARSTSDTRSAYIDQTHPIHETRTIARNVSAGTAGVDAGQMYGRVGNPVVAQPHFARASRNISEIRSAVPAPVTEAAPAPIELPTKEVAEEPVVEKTEPKQPEKTPTKKPTKTVQESGESVDKPVVDTSSNQYMTTLANEIHRLTNLERERAGRPALRYDNALAAIATKHSQDMAKRDYFAHTSPTGCTLTCRINGAGYSATAWGENIAWRSSSQLPGAKELATYFVEQWMNSEGHRKNILNGNFTHEGVGLSQIGNKVYATVNFSRPR